MYAIIEVYLNYDYVEGVECAETFDTKEEAESKLKQIKDSISDAQKKRSEYIDEWVDEIELPETDYQGWVEYLKQFHPFGAMYVFPKDFKRGLKSYLRTYTNAKLEGYDPPPCVLSRDLYVVEIKE